MEIQARNLNEYLRLDKLQRNKNIESILRGSLGLLSGLLERLSRKMIKSSFEVIREFAHSGPCEEETAQEIEEIEYLDMPLLE